MDLVQLRKRIKAAEPAMQRGRELEADRHGNCISSSMDAAALGRRGSTGLLLYRDAEGNVTERRIRVIDTFSGRNGFRYIKAFCYLKDEERTFRADRIVSFEPAAAAAVQALPVQAASAPRRDSRGPAESLGNRALNAFGRVFSMASFLLIVAFFGVALLRGAGDLAGRFLSRHDRAASSYRYTPSRPAELAMSKPLVKPAPPAPGPRKPAAEAARQAAFREATGIADPGLAEFYEKADGDRNGSLSWSEIAAFQSLLKRHCYYLNNATALRPDEFFRQGGGDCEDWALVTCGLLRYWGIASYVGIFRAEAAGTGHAVCLVYVPEQPTDKLSFSARGLLTSQGTPVRDGWYVPIDYEVVGGLTDAVSPKATLRAFLEPERIYGLPM